MKWGRDGHVLAGPGAVENVIKDLRAHFQSVKNDEWDGVGAPPTSWVLSKLGSKITMGPVEMAQVIDLIRVHDPWGKGQVD